MSSSSCNVSSWFLNSSLNSIFFDPIGVAFTLSSNVDLVDDCYVCDDVWPVY